MATGRPTQPSMVYSADTTNLGVIMTQGTKGGLAQARNENDVIWGLQERKDDPTGVNICVAYKAKEHINATTEKHDVWKFQSIPAVLTNQLNIWLDVWQNPCLVHQNIKIYQDWL